MCVAELRSTEKTAKKAALEKQNLTRALAAVLCAPHTMQNSYSRLKIIVD